MCDVRSVKEGGSGRRNGNELQKEREREGKREGRWKQRGSSIRKRQPKRRRGNE